MNTKGITPSTFDEKLGEIAQKFFDNSTGGAYSVKIPETPEYRAFNVRVKQLIASEVIGQDISHEAVTERLKSIPGKASVHDAVHAVNDRLKIQRKALGIETQPIDLDNSNNSNKEE